jgi:hypothetical protein
MKLRMLWSALGLIIMGALSMIATAQSGEFAASMEVIEAGVTVQRVNTTNPIAVTVEAIVGVGDIIRTDATGTARITFFADGTDVTIQPDSEYRIVAFSGDDSDFDLTVEVIAGQALHRLKRALGADSSYDVQTPGMTLAARGTAFAVRVESDGRSAMLVTEGTVSAENSTSSADVPVDFGIRAAAGAALSEVVRAKNFSELDSALDGCTAVLTTPDDVSLNVRGGPAQSNTLIGTIFAQDIDILYGVNETGGWYRIMFADGFGWILSRTATLQPGCAGLRVFPDTHTEGGVGAVIITETPETPVVTETPTAP